MIDSKVGMRDLLPRTAVMMAIDRRIDRRILDEARSLQQGGWKVTVIVRPPLSPEDVQEESYPDVEIIRVDPQRAQNLLQSVNVDKINKIIADFPQWHWEHILVDYLLFTLEAVVRPAAVYVGHDIQLLPVAAYAAAYHGSHLVYDTHEFFQGKNFPTPGLDEHYAYLEQWLAPTTDTVITVNQEIAKELARLNNIPEPHVILNAPAIDQARLPLPHGKKLHESLGIASDKKILLYQGNLGNGRNLDGLIEAMPYVKHSEVVLVYMGADADGTLAKLQQQASEAGLIGKSVFFQPTIKQNELLDYTSSADLGIIPYLPYNKHSYLVSPNKLYEFLAAGLPILASDLPVLRATIGDQGVGMNMSLDGPQAIAHAVDTMFDSDLDQYRERCRSLSTNYTWDHQGKKVLKIYESLGNSNSKQQQLYAKLNIVRQEISKLRYDLAAQELENICNDVKVLEKQSEL